MSNKSDYTGTIIGFIVFGFFSLGGLYATIMSFTYVFAAYQRVDYASMIIWFALGLFMIIWCIYFSRELIQLMKTKS